MQQQAAVAITTYHAARPGDECFAAMDRDFHSDVHAKT